MCAMMDAFEIINAAGGRKLIANATGLAVNSVLYWERRNRISCEHWPALVRLAAEHGRSDITLETLQAHVVPKRRRAA